jgi:hypothetical protein
MFNDRDLGVLGAGALLAVLCLFLPFSFVGKVITGFLVLVIFMVAALMRLGPDRVPIETWLIRKTRFALGMRKFVNQREPSTLKTEQSAPKPAPAPAPVSPIQAPHQSAAVDFRPLDLAWNEVGIYPLLTALLSVVGVYFVVWLARGGAEQIGLYFK